ncbi:MAG: multicopper oxidase domain-containing protein [Deltaproteobacteria bacterium]
MYVLRRTAILLSGLALILAMIAGCSSSSPDAPLPLPGTPLDSKTIPKYIETISSLAGSNLGIVDARAGGTLTVEMVETQARILPTAMYPGLGSAGTYVFQYNVSGTTYQAARDTYLGPVILAGRGVPLNIRYINSLGTAAASQVLAYKNATDQTLHWADPAHQHMSMQHYAGLIPAVVHVHGAEVESRFDGGPDTWFTSAAVPGDTYQAVAFSNVGPAFSGGLTFTDTYTYTNDQEAAPIWFHDHALGATRLNVYAGLAGAYLIMDNPAATTYRPTTPSNLPPPVPLVIQDRMFDTRGQLYFPNEGVNPMIHPFWVPEFFGDTIVINGKSWPKMRVSPKRYRFILLNGSNARFYELLLEGGPSIWVVGTDGGYLDQPVNIAAPNKLIIAPGERYEVIIDFAGFAGQSFIMTNTANSPYPDGDAPDPQTVGQIMKFEVANTAVADPSCSPALGGCGRRAAAPIVRLVNPATGALNFTPQNIRRLTINEVMGMGGPLEAVLNNSKWDGTLSSGIGPSFPDGVTELPQVGGTEIWEIINLTGDAHPIHLHLTQFQLIGRQPFDADSYTAAYDALFPGGNSPVAGVDNPIPAGQYIPGYGPPRAYAYYNNPANIPAGATPWLGGNPDPTPFFQGAPSLPLAHEAGWKDTVIMYPGQVSRIAVRWTTQSLPVGSETPGINQYPFDPTSGPGYVWHCHILDHEDNEMMRPLKVKATLQQ